jgi:hypothetical protein
MRLTPIRSALSALAILLLTGTSCEPNCESGFEREDGVCACPEGRFVAEDSCVALEPNQFYWIRKTECIDDTARIKFVPTRLFGFPILECQILNRRGKMTIFNTAGDDVLDTVATGANLALVYCPVQGLDCIVKFEGELVHPDTIRGEFVYRWEFMPDSVLLRVPSVMWR